MASITLRSDKGSPLTNAEVDSNFSNLNTELGQKESASNKGIAGGYASLDAGGKVPSTQLPSYVDDVVEAATFLSLPSPGETGKIYVVLDNNKSYRWSGSAYIEIASSPGSTDAISEGSTNLYFTNARARAAISATGSLSYNSSTGVLSYTAPTSLSQLTNDSGFITSSALSSYLTSATAASTYQTILVSGTSIKTVNGNSLLGSGNIQIDAGVASFNTRTGAVTLTSGDVTTALGYTPYNSSNPSGYITSSALSSYLALSGGTLTGASTVAVSSWTKWTLETTGVTAKARQGSDGNGLNFTSNAQWTGSAWAEDDTSKKKFAYIQHLGNGRHEFRTSPTGSGVSWTTSLTIDETAVNSTVALTQGGNQVLHAGNYTSYSPSLTGSGASGTWGISITGNAATATSADQIDGVAFRNTGSNAGTAADSLASNGITYASSNISLFSQTDGALYSQAYNGDWQHQIFGDYRTGQIALRGKNFGTWQSWRTVLDSGNYSSYALPLSGGTVTGRANIFDSVIRQYLYTRHIEGKNWDTYDTSAAPLYLNYTSNQPVYIGSSVHLALHAGNAPRAQNSDLMYYAGFTLNANDMPSNTTGFTYANNAPHTGPVARFSTGGGYDLWLNATYSGGGSLSFRTRNGDAGSNNPWRMILNDSNYSSYALPLSGGTLTGELHVNTGGIGQLRLTAPGGAQGLWVRSGYDSDGSATPVSSATNVAFQSSGNSGGTFSFISGNTKVLSIGGVNNSLVALQQSGNQVLHAGNYSSYALPLSGGTVSGLTYFTANESIQLKGIRGQFSAGSDSQGISLFSNVDIGYPSGWGGGLGYTPSRGLSTYGSIRAGYGNENTCIFIGAGSVTTTNALRINWHVDGDLNYFIGKRAGAWVQPMDISFYTGVRYHAHNAYGGHRWYTTGYDSTLAFSVGEGDNNVRVANTLFVGGNTALHAGNYTSYSPSYSYFDDYQRGNYRVIADYGGFSTWYIRGDGRWVFARGHDWTVSFDLNLGSGTAGSNNGWAVLGQVTSNASNGTWRGVRFSKYVNGSQVDGDVRAQRYYLNNDSDYILNAGDGSMRLQNGNGYIDIGPKNSSWCHIYSDRTFYTNQDIYSYGNLQIHSGNYTSYAGGLSSANTWTAINYFRSNRNTTSDSPPLQAYSSDGGGAIMSFHRANYYAVNMGLDSDNVFRIGGWSAGANRLQMDMSGNLTMAGNVTAYSDERLKKDWSPIAAGFVDRLAGILAGTYTRIDSEERQAGVSAQKMREILPEVVSEDNEGTLALAYGNAAMVSAVELARELVMLKKELAELKSRLH